MATAILPPPTSSAFSPFWGEEGWKAPVDLAKGEWEYMLELLALLPHGRIWDPMKLPEKDSLGNPRLLLQKLFLGLAGALSDLDHGMDDVMNEKDPRTASALLDDWERICGLPDDCLPNPDHGDEARRQAITAKIANRGGQSIPYYLGIADRLNYTTVKIFEFTPAYAGVAHAGDPCYSEDWIHVWEVYGATTKLTYFRTGSSRSGDRLAVYDGDELACYLQTLKPAHTLVIASPPSIVANGDFASGSTGWTLGTGWAVLNNRAIHSAGAGDLEQDVGATAGKHYRLTFTIPSVGIGSITPSLGGNQLDAITWAGTITRWIECGSMDTILRFEADASFNGTIDDIHLVRIF